MAVLVTCPNPSCGKSFQVEDTVVGHPGLCQACGHPFLFGENPAGAPPKGNPQVTAADTPGQVLASSEEPTTFVQDGLHQPPSQVGRFQIRQCLGQGGYGIVYRAFDPQLDRDVALKMPKAEALADGRLVERFMREARAAGRLRHPHIVPVFEVGKDGGQYYFASAFIEGQSLAAILSAEGQGLEVRRAVRIVRALAEAVAYAHEQGIVHRDIKPLNVMMDQKDQPYLTDFGLAAWIQDAQGLTPQGTLLGTPAYLAPEQVAGQKREALQASDQYALGVVLYELLVGHPPYQGPTMVVLYQVVNTPVRPPREFRADLPPELEAICLKALEKRPEQRYPNCLELAKALEQWEAMQTKRHEGLSPSSGKAATVDQEPQGAKAKKVSRKQLLAVVSGSLLAVLGAVLALSILFPGKGKLVIENNNPSVEVVIKLDGVKIIDRAANREIELKVGEHEIELVEPKEGYRLSTKKFTIERNGKKTVVELFRVPDTLPPTQESRDRKAAEWVLNKGGVVQVKRGGEIVEVTKKEDLPRENFTVKMVSLANQPGLQDADMENISGLTGLEELLLYHNPQLTDGSLRFIQSLTNLRILDLIGTDITDNGLKIIIPLVNLSCLKLATTKVTDKGLEVLSSLKNLEDLAIGGDPDLVGKGFHHLARIPKLRLLGLHGFHFTELTWKQLGQLTNIEELFLNDSNIDDAGLVHLKSLIKVEHFEAHRTRITDAGLKHLLALPKLKGVGADSPDVTAAALEDLNRKLANR